MGAGISAAQQAARRTGGDGRRKRAKGPASAGRALKPLEGGLDARVMAEVRTLVLAVGVDEAEATGLLRVMDRLEQIQAKRGVAAAVALARRVRAIWLR